MIGLLRGKALQEDASGLVVIDVAGVGYEVMVPLGSLLRAPRDSEGRIQLYVHTHLREDSLELFGFASLAERQAFRLLINIPNVGPKTAVNVLSALPLEELGQAVREGDRARLGKVPGIGKKTVERLLMELKDKLFPTPELSRAPVATAPARRLTTALTNMGYRPAEAEYAVKSLGGSLDDLPLDELLKRALSALTRQQPPTR